MSKVKPLFGAEKTSSQREYAPPDKKLFCISKNNGAEEPPGRSNIVDVIASTALYQDAEATDAGTPDVGRLHDHDIRRLLAVLIDELDARSTTVEDSFTRAVRAREAARRGAAKRWDSEKAGKCSSYIFR